MVQAYPRGTGSEADAMAANELSAHCSLQPPVTPREAQHLCILLGGFVPRSGPTAGEQVSLLLQKDPNIKELRMHHVSCRPHAKLCFIQQSAVAVT